MTLIDALALVQFMGAPNRAQRVLAMQDDVRAKEVAIYDEASMVVAKHAGDLIREKTT